MPPPPHTKPENVLKVESNHPFQHDRDATDMPCLYSEHKSSLQLSSPLLP